MCRVRLAMLVVLINVCLPVFDYAQDAAPQTGLRDYSDKGYVLYIPGNILSLSSVPVLVCLPGLGVSAKEDVDHWSSSAEKKGLVILDLDVDYSRIASSSDIDALYSRIMSNIDLLAKQYPLNAQSLFLAGTSAGGMMVISLGLRYPDKFSALGVVSGAVLRFGAEQWVANARGKYFYMAHGTKDEIVPINMYYSTKEILERNGAIVESCVMLGDKHPVSPAGYTQVVEWMSGLSLSRQ